MIPSLYVAAGIALLMLGLLIQAGIFRAIHDDPPSTYKLFAVRDNLVRLVIDGRIPRPEPHFEALYRNVNILLKGCRRLNGPQGWDVAEADGRYLAHNPHDHVKLAEVPHGSLPASLQPVVVELTAALEHIVRNHLGVFVVVDERRRELSRIQKEQARQLLRMMDCGSSCPA